MFEPAFFVDAAIIFGIGLWPILLVLAAATVRTINTRRRTAAAAATAVSLPHVTEKLTAARPAVAMASA